MKRKRGEEDNEGVKVSRRKEVDIEDLPSEILMLILYFCGEFAFVGKYVCREWYGVYTEFKDMIMPQRHKKEKVGMFPVELFKWFAETYPQNRWNTALMFYKGAAYCGNKTLFDHLSEIIKHSCVPIVLNCVKLACGHAALGGQSELLDSLTDVIDDPERSNILSNSRHVCSSNHLEVNFFLQWHNSCVRLACKNAARGGHLNVLQWLKLHYNCIPYKKVALLAAENGHLNVVKWVWTWNYLKEIKVLSPSLGNLLAHTATTNNHLEIVEWIRKERIGTCICFEVNEALPQKKIPSL
jgi:hypothetical protein